VRDADLVVLAVPAATAVPVVRELGAELDGKVVVDVTNRVDLANPAAVLDGSSNSEAIQAAVPGARVVKAFNTAFASRQADPRAEGVQLDGFVAGDDEAAKAQAMELAASIGFRPVDAGGLAMARVLEGMALLLIGLQVRYEAPWQAGWKVVGPLGRVA
jgi:predicted dinucleotide-binding enzyme